MTQSKASTVTPLSKYPAHATTFNCPSPLPIFCSGAEIAAVEYKKENNKIDLTIILSIFPPIYKY